MAGLGSRQGELGSHKACASLLEEETTTALAMITIKFYEKR